MLKGKKRRKTKVATGSRLIQRISVITTKNIVIGRKIVQRT